MHPSHQVYREVDEAYPLAYDTCVECYGCTCCSKELLEDPCNPQYKFEEF